MNTLGQPGLGEDELRRGAWAPVLGINIDLSR